jgi:predicted Zn-dependent protease
MILIVGLGISACAIVPQTPSSRSSPSSPSAEPAEQKNEQTTSLQHDSPQAVASLRLTEQARVLLESGKVDDAITTLERALNVNPSNGQTYYYLAEAWIKKGNPSQAREFNRLAAMYLRDDPVWMNRVNDQEQRIKTH